MTRVPRLLLVGNFLSSRRASRSIIEDLSEKLRERGHAVITTSQSSNPWFRAAQMLGTVLLRCREYDLAVVDLYSGRAFLWGDAVSRLLTVLRRPFILVLRGGALPTFAECRRERVQACLRRATVVMAPSSYLLEQMSPYRAGLRLIPNTIEADLYGFRIRHRPEPRLIWLRAFHDIYNAPLATRVVGQLCTDFPRIQLTMIGADKGDGSLQHTRRVATQLGVTPHVEIHTRVPKKDVPTHLSTGDIFLNTTNVDNTPVSVIEAMACGLCVVSTNVGGLPHLLEHERDALLVPPDDPTAMSAAVRRVLTEDGLAGRLSVNARSKALAFDWSVVLPQWEALLGAVGAGCEMTRRSSWQSSNR